jgi:hypothetical protein
MPYKVNNVKISAIKEVLMPSFKFYRLVLARFFTTDLRGLEGHYC